MESIGCDRNQVRAEQERDRLRDVFQGRAGSRLYQEIGLSRRKRGQALGLTSMTAHDEAATAVEGERPYRHGHPPALHRTDTTAVSGHEDGDHHRDDVDPRRAHPMRPVAMIRWSSADLKLDDDPFGDPTKTALSSPITRDVLNVGAAGDPAAARVRRVQFEHVVELPGNTTKVIVPPAGAGRHDQPSTELGQPDQIDIAAFGDPQVRPQARNRRLEIEHAVTHAAAVGEQDDGKVLYLGPDQAGNLPEVVTVLRETGPRS